jgi:L-ascorbate metabolism protein UlaG (beta-lactamase superfamily)
MEARRVLHAADLHRWTPNAKRRLPLQAAVPHTGRVWPTSGVLTKPAKQAAKVARILTVADVVPVATNVAPTGNVNQTKQQKLLKCAGQPAHFFYLPVYTRTQSAAKVPGTMSDGSGLTKKAPPTARLRVTRWLFRYILGIRPPDFTSISFPSR